MIVVQLVNIAVIVGVNHLAITILLIIFRMCGNPFCIGSRMVRNPVQPHLHVQLMSTSHKGLQVGNGAIFGIRFLEIGSSIRAVNASTTRIDRHEPYNVDTQRLQFAQTGLSSCESALCRERAHVHLIDDATTLCTLGGSVVDVIDIVG